MGTPRCTSARLTSSTVRSAIEAFSIAVDDVEPRSASPFARSLVFAYVAAYLYEQDAPLAERKAQALTLDRALLGELLGQAELRELVASSGGYRSAAADPDTAGSSTGWDTELWSPVLDLRLAASATLTYASNFQDYAGNGDMWLDGSIDGGLTWTTIRTQTDDDPTGGTAATAYLPEGANAGEIVARLAALPEMLEVVDKATAVAFSDDGATIMDTRIEPIIFQRYRIINRIEIGDWHTQAFQHLLRHQRMSSQSGMHAITA